MGDEVVHRDRPGGDPRQGVLVVGGGGAVGADDRQLAVVHEVRVERDDRVVLRQAAEEADATLPRDVPNRLLLGHAGGGGGDGHVDATTVREVEDRLDDVDLAGTDDLVRLDDVGGLLESCAVELDERHPGRAVGPSQPHVQAADRAGAHHDDVVTLADPRDGLRVDGARERLGHGCLRVGEAVRDAVEAVDGEHDLRHDHVLGEAAVELVAHRDLVRAHRHPAARALVAPAARNGGDDLDPIARLPAATPVSTDGGPHLHDLTGDLVADHPRRVEVLVAGAEDLDVRAARRAGVDADLDLVLGRRGLVRLLDSQVTGGVETGHLHASSAPSSGCSRDRTVSGSSASRSCLALSGSTRIRASCDRMPTWLSPTAAMPMRDADVVAVPVDAGGELHERQRVARDRVLALHRAVGDGEALAHVGRDGLLALEHRVDVGRVDRAGLDEDAAGETNRFVRRRRLSVEHRPRRDRAGQPLICPPSVIVFTS